MTSKKTVGLWSLSMLVVGCAASWVPGQPASDPGPEAVFQQANKFFEAGKLLDAEPCYLAALKIEDPEKRRKCYDRLLGLYVRLGRQDQAIQIGRRYQDYLKSTGDDGPVRNIALQMGLCYQVLGHVETAATFLEKSLNEQSPGAPLSPALRLTALLTLATGADLRADKERAERFHRRLEKEALAQLVADPPLSPRDRIDCTWKLAESYQARNFPAKALTYLNPLSKIHLELKDWAGQVETLRLSGDLEVQLNHPEAAAKNYQSALELHEKHFPLDRLTAADLAKLLALVAKKEKRYKEEQTWRQQALVDYQKVLDDARRTRPGQGSVAGAFWKMQALLQESRQFRQALQLVTTQAESWAGGGLLQAKVRAERGSLELWAGVYGQARVLLRDAVLQLQRQEPVNLSDLPRSLVNLAVVELATDEINRAETLAKDCQALYRQHRLADDLLLLETHNILGNCAAQNGNYKEAVNRFRNGLDLCAKLGDKSDPQHSNILLNLALLHKSQGDPDEALRYCLEAKKVFQRFAEPDDLGHAAFDAAQANLFLAQSNLGDAAALAPRILDLCRKHQIERGPLVLTARHCQALEFLRRRDFAQADLTLKTILTLQEQEKQNLLLPRTLNYLALSAELQGQLKEAEAYLQRAALLQKNNPRAFPATHFNTQRQLAAIAEALQRKADVPKHLEEAIAVVENARYQTFGDSQQRSGYFAQFAPAFDQLVDWHVREGNIESALNAVARGRSRAFLDQLQLANVDPRRGLKPDDAKKLLPQETSLRQQISSLRAKAMMIPVELIDGNQAKKLLADFDQAQRDYADVWREIVNANPIFKELNQNDLSNKNIALLRANILGDKKMLLVYHLGKERSQLLIVGPKKMEAFPLEVDAELAQRADLAAEPSKTEGGPNTRGLVFKPRAKLPQTPVPPESIKAGPSQPLGLGLARSLVEQYRDDIAHPDFQPTRGLVLKSKSAKEPVATQRFDLLGNIFLPPAARKVIAEANPDLLVVIPDGPLHKLPLEALLTESGAKSRYVLDDMPPMVYAPSVAALTTLSARPRPKADGPPSLLTVGNPAYPLPDKKIDPALIDKAPPATRHVLGLQGQLTRLPKTADECANIKKQFGKQFGPKAVTSLVGDEATEKAVVQALAGKRYVHIAAHGFADERFGNLHGALALTPAAGEFQPENDGFLSLHEIYQLPLKDCELAVLSACSTFVGPQQPLEAGVTLASGFLAAGARRVVASHWSVDDASTAQLMSTFMAEIAAGEKQGLSHAQALQRARQQLRANPRWASPFHWAPFVLIGPAD